LHAGKTALLQGAEKQANEKIQRGLFTGLFEQPLLESKY